MSEKAKKARDLIGLFKVGYQFFDSCTVGENDCGIVGFLQDHN
jgi:hypothetical protein